MEKPKTLYVVYEKTKYLYFKGRWTKNNIGINTQLAQKLDEYCLKNNLLTKDDLKQYEEPKKVKE
jgi:hypothetical protein